MDELFSSILSLPALPKNELERNKWLSLLSNLENKTYYHFLTFISSAPYQISPLLSSSSLDQLKAYLLHWEFTADAALNWYENIEKTWFQLIKKPICADDFILVILELLPNDLKLLAKLQQHLDEAMSIDCVSKRGCALAQLNVGICAKIMDLSAKYQQEAAQEVKSVAEELQKQFQISKLELTCSHYADELSDKLQKIFDELNYYQPNCDVKDERKVFTKIIHDIEVGECSLLVDSELTLDLLERYLLINDIKNSMKNPYLLASEKMVEFSAKFNLYRLLQKRSRSQEVASNPPDSKVYYLFPSTSVEQQFIKIANLLTEDVEISQQTLNEEKIAELNVACQDYKKDLETNIKSILDNQFLFKKGITIRENSLLFEELITDMQINKQALLYNNSKLIPLIEKFLIMTDMQHTLTNSTHKITERLHIFTVKYSHQKPLLEKSVNALSYGNFNYYFNLNKFYGLFPHFPQEQQFLKLAENAIEEKPSSPS